MPTIAQAQDGVAARSVTVERWVEEWDPATQSWIKVDAKPAAIVRPATKTAFATTQTVITEYTYVDRAAVPTAARYAQPVSRKTAPAAVAQYGPFQVIDNKRAALVGTTGPMSLRYFDAMLRDFPQIRRLDMIEAPGTSDDIANLAVGRRIRAAGIATHVPDGGSVRSGAVELFLAGETRTMDEGAEFAVHSWLDNYGRQPKDFAPDAPENRLYLDYYREMGMSAARAREFYAMTNSVPHHSAKWLDATEMRSWLPMGSQKLNRKRVLDLQFLAAHTATPEATHAPQIRVASLDSLLAFP